MIPASSLQPSLTDLISRVSRFSTQSKIRCSLSDSYDETQPASAAPNVFSYLPAILEAETRGPLISEEEAVNVWIRWGVLRRGQEREIRDTVILPQAFWEATEIEYDNALRTLAIYLSDAALSPIVLRRLRHLTSAVKRRWNDQSLSFSSLGEILADREDDRAAAADVNAMETARDRATSRVPLVLESGNEVPDTYDDDFFSAQLPTDDGNINDERELELIVMDSNNLTSTTDASSAGRDDHVQTQQGRLRFTGPRICSECAKIDAEACTVLTKSGPGGKTPGCESCQKRHKKCDVFDRQTGYGLELSSFTTLLRDCKALQEQVTAVETSQFISQRRQRRNHLPGSFSGMGPLLKEIHEKVEKIGLANGIPMRTSSIDIGE